MEEVFERKVSEKKSRLSTSELELETKLKEIKEKAEAQKLEFEEMKKAFAEEKRGQLYSLKSQISLQFPGCVKKTLNLMGLWFQSTDNSF